MPQILIRAAEFAAPDALPHHALGLRRERNVLSAHTVSSEFALHRVACDRQAGAFGPRARRSGCSTNPPHRSAD